jgi:hypothetical protein
MELAELPLTPVAEAEGNAGATGAVEAVAETAIDAAAAAPAPPTGGGQVGATDPATTPASEEVRRRHGARSFFLSERCAEDEAGESPRWQVLV